MSRNRTVNYVCGMFVVFLFGLTACSLKTPTPAWTLPRRGTLTELRGTVEIRATEGISFASAVRGSAWDVNAQIRTGEAGTARLYLVDGIYLRLAPNTSVINQSRPSQWLLVLERGILWVILNGQSVTIVTPLGQVTAEGDAVAFKYDPGDPTTTADGVWIIQCLRASCEFADDTQSISLSDLGQLSVGATVQQSQVSRADVDEFVANNPEASGLLINQRASAPAPSSAPLPTAKPTTTSGVSALTALASSPSAAAEATSASATATASVTSTFTPTQTPTVTPRPTRIVVPTRPSSTHTPLPPTDTPLPPPPPPPPPNPTAPPAPTQPPPAPTQAPQRTPGPTKPA